MEDTFCARQCLRSMRVCAVFCACADAVHTLNTDLRLFPQIIVAMFSSVLAMQDFDAEEFDFDPGPLATTPEDFFAQLDELGIKEALDEGDFDIAKDVVLSDLAGSGAGGLSSLVKKEVEQQKEEDEKVAARKAEESDSDFIERDSSSSEPGSPVSSTSSRSSSMDEEMRSTTKCSLMAKRRRLSRMKPYRRDREQRAAVRPRTLPVAEAGEPRGK